MRAIHIAVRRLTKHAVTQAYCRGWIASRIVEKTSFNFELRDL
jgi:hypothetical protein